MVQCGADKILSIVRDLTESKRAQTEAHHSRLELAHVSRVTMLAEITASLAHELNQPLTAIVANAQAAQHMAASSRPVDPQILRETLDDIVEAGQRAGDVIGRLRTWLNREQFLPQQLDVNQVIMNVEHLIRSELILRHVRMSFELESGLPDVSADRVQVQQVILNLAMNGIDAMQDRPGPDRHLAISTSAIGDEVQIAVRDRGTGIRAEHMDKLFDAFFSTKPNGLGIGLRICASIVGAHGGRIWAANNDDGGGATFCFTLPAVARFR
jgi:two-component system sensor kinase FixL